MRLVLASLSILSSLSLGHAALAAGARDYVARPEIKTSDLEKVKLTGRHTLFLPRDQAQAGTLAPAKGGHQLLIGVRGPSGTTLFGKAELLGNRAYASRKQIERAHAIRIGAYKEKSVVAYLPSKDPQDPRPRFYTVIGPKSGRGPLLIERRPSRLAGGKPLEYSVLAL